MPEVEVGDVNISERFSQLTDNGSASKCLLVGCQAIFHTKFRRAVHHPHERIASIGLPSHETTPFAKRARCPINDLVGHVHPTTLAKREISLTHSPLPQPITRTRGMLCRFSSVCSSSIRRENRTRSPGDCHHSLAAFVGLPSATGELWNARSRSTRD